MQKVHSVNSFNLCKTIFPSIQNLCKINTINSAEMIKRVDFSYNYIYSFALGLIEKILCVGCGNKPLTAAGLIDLFVVDCHGETGSNARHQSEEASMFMECFIVDCEGKSTFSSLVKYMCHTLASIISSNFYVFHQY